MPFSAFNTDDSSESYSSASSAPSKGQDFWGIYDVGGSLIQNELNRKRASDQMDFQERMSGSSWQRGVKDMIAAGINPMLAASKGGASSPEGAKAEAVSPTKDAVHSAQAGRLMEASVDKMEAETRNVGFEGDRNEQIASILKAIGPRVVQGVSGVESSAAAIGEGAAKLEGVIREALKGFGDLPGMFGKGLDKLIDAIMTRLKPQMGLPMPAAVREVVDVVKERSKMPSPVRTHPAWGVGEYERAQAERFNRARQSPASRRRSGG